jgi:hypothetical protein
MDCHPTWHSYVDAHDYLLNHVDYANIVDWPNIFFVDVHNIFLLSHVDYGNTHFFVDAHVNLIIMFFSSVQCLFLLMHMPIYMYQMHDSSFKC